jgi:hypothetical protein
MKPRQLGGLVIVPFSLCGAILLSHASGAQFTRASGTGLKGEYYSNNSLTGNPVLTRQDSRVSFAWITGSPAKGIPADQFSVRWSGQLEAPVSGTFVLSSTTDDEMRVYLAGKKLIECAAAAGRNGIGSASVTLVAGQRYNLTVEYVERSGNATALLQWAYPGVAQQLIPTAYLYPAQALDPSAPSDVAPSVALTAPSAGASFTAPARINLTSSVSDADGSVTKVEFFAGPLKIGEDTAAPYTFSWVGVTPGTYTLAAKATDNSGNNSISQPVTVTVNPSAGGSSVVSVPTNLRVEGIWQPGDRGPTDILTWDPVPGAASYNLYQYDVLIAKGVPATSHLVAPQLYYPYVTYTVTAVDSSGMETIPSNIVQAQGAYNPDYQPLYLNPTPERPYNLLTVPEWNSGRPRVRLTWLTPWLGAGMGFTTTFNVYRDGQRVATGLWGLNYIDQNVQPGETHQYQVTGVNMRWKTVQESAISAPIAITVPAQQPPATSTPVTITGVTPNDDSVVVAFAAVPGAVDYRCYQQGSPTNRKYSGGGLKIEMNGLNPLTGADLVVEAVDKLGPFQKHDGFQGPGMMRHDGSLLMEVNGLGDPSNVPNVLARSAVFHVNCQPRTLTGAQVFFDNFRGSLPFEWAPAPDSLLPHANGLVRGLQNDKWLLYNVQGDLDNSRFFVQGSHFMDTFYDGDRPGGQGPLHNNISSFLMKPKQTADISDGKVLHVTFEVDPHMGPRRWCDVFVTAADDPMLVPGKFLDFNVLPTVKGDMFRWEITESVHGAQLFSGPNGVLKMVNLMPNQQGIQRRTDSTQTGSWNGSVKDLDLRRRYDLYLSQTQFRIMEGGTVIKEGTFPTGATLPFTKLSVYYVHQVYHTGVERTDLMMYYTKEAYWYNHRPYQDERHWDNMGFEVLSSFPK